MAEKKTQKGKKGQRKIGRNKKKCERYRLEGRREKNKERKRLKRLKKLGKKKKYDTSN